METEYLAGGTLAHAEAVYTMAANGCAAILWLLAGVLAVAIIGYVRNRDP